MTISIAIATYNRACELEKTLVSLLQLDTNGCPEHEILVIDNNSTDHTPDVAGRMDPLFGGRLRYVREEKQGLSHARNRAIDECRSEVIAFLDDDVDVDPSWMKGLLSAYASEECAAVGGRAYLIYPATKPRWLDEPFVGLLTRVELGPSRRPSGAGELFGVNLSFRMEWLRKSGGFRTDLGRTGTTLFGCEDDEMLERIALFGGKILYEPAATVGHRVPPNRISRKWFWKRSLWGTASTPRTWPDAHITGYELIRVAWHIVLMGWRSVRAGLRYGPRSSACFDQVLRFASRTGALLGLIGELRRRGGLLGRSLDPNAKSSKSQTPSTSETSLQTLSEA